MGFENQDLAVANLGVVEYQRALALQNAILEARQRGEIGDTLLLLQHPHVFTLGRGADEHFLLAGRPAEVPVYRVSRGGEVTYHGPGQLVGYPILKLDGRARDVHGYLRKIEAAIIHALAQYGIAAARRDGLTGIWIGTRKIGSIGVGIKRWVTCHGFALNVAPDLRMFSGIVPCGIQHCEMTSIAALGYPKVTIEDFAPTMQAGFAATFGFRGVCAIDPIDLWRLLSPADAPAETPPDA